MCPQPFPAVRDKMTKEMYNAVLPLEHPLFFAPTELITFRDKNPGTFCGHTQPRSIHPIIGPPEPTFFQIRVDAPIENRDQEDKPRYIRTPST